VPLEARSGGRRTEGCDTRSPSRQEARSELDGPRAVCRVFSRLRDAYSRLPPRQLGSGVKCLASAAVRIRAASISAYFRPGPWVRSQLRRYRARRLTTTSQPGSVGSYEELTVATSSRQKTGAEDPVRIERPLGLGPPFVARPEMPTPVLFCHVSHPIGHVALAACPNENIARSL
jgi:hypothetical protein